MTDKVTLHTSFVVFMTREECT